MGPAVERQLDSDSLVKAFEGSRAIGRHMAGDEQHRLHRSACA
jgi:hypothetical protein